jgi:hypothetical protein
VVASVTFLSSFARFKASLAPGAGKAGAKTSAAAPLSPSAYLHTVSGTAPPSIVAASLLSTFLADMETTDVLLFHLHKVRDQAAAALSSAAAAAASASGPSPAGHQRTRSGGGEPKQPLVLARRPPQGESSQPGGLAAAASSSFILPEYYLWKKMLATYASGVWRRWFFVSSMDVLCSMHNKVGSCLAPALAVR